MTVTLQYTELDPAWLLAKHLFLKEKDPISCDSSNLMPDGQTLPDVVPIAVATTVPLQALRGDLRGWQVLLFLGVGAASLGVARQVWQAGVRRYSGASS